MSGVKPMIRDRVMSGGCGMRGCGGVRGEGSVLRYRIA